MPLNEPFWLDENNNKDNAGNTGMPLDDDSLLLFNDKKNAGDTGIPHDNPSLLDNDEKNDGDTSMPYNDPSSLDKINTEGNAGDTGIPDNDPSLLNKNSGKEDDSDIGTPHDNAFLDNDLAGGILPHNVAVLDIKNHGDGDGDIGGPHDEALLDNVNNNNNGNNKHPRSLRHRVVTTNHNKNNNNNKDADGDYYYIDDKYANEMIEKKDYSELIIDTNDNYDNKKKKNNGESLGKTTEELSGNFLDEVKLAHQKSHQSLQLSNNNNGNNKHPQSLRYLVVTTNHNNNNDQDADGDYYYKDETLVNDDDDFVIDDKYANEMIEKKDYSDLVIDKDSNYNDKYANEMIKKKDYSELIIDTNDNYDNKNNGESLGKTTEELSGNFLDEVNLAHQKSHQSLQHSASDQKSHQSLQHSASDHQFTLTFGCQTSISGLFQTQLADGIMGLENSKSSFWNQMFHAGVIASRAFSLCFVNANEAERHGTEAGILTLGGVDERLNHWNKENGVRGMRYARNWKQRGWFEIYVKAVYLRMPPLPTTIQKNGDDNDGINATEGMYSKTLRLLNIDLKTLNDIGIVIDSGTTESFLPSHLAKSFETAFEKLTGETFRDEYSPVLFGGGYHEGGDDNEESEGNVDDYFPTILLQLESAPPLNKDGDGSSRKSQEDEIEWKDADGKALPGFTGYLDETSPHDPLFEIPPRNYLKYFALTKLYRNGLHLSEQAGIGILGANSMDGHNILFDVDNERIGFAESNCDYGDLIER